MHALLQTAAERADLPGGYGVALLQTLLALGAVCILAWVVLRWGARRGMGIGMGRGRVRVIDRVPLDARRSLYLVQIGERVLLVGAGDGGSPSLLLEIEASELPPEPEARQRSFADILRRLGKRSEP